MDLERQKMLAKWVKKGKKSPSAMARDSPGHEDRSLNVLMDHIALEVSNKPQWTRSNPTHTESLTLTLMVRS